MLPTKVSKILITLLLMFNLVFLFFNVTYYPEEIYHPHNLSAPADRLTISDILKEDGIIKIYDNYNLTIAPIAPTGSMIPILDEKSTVIEIVPKSQDDLFVGDIVAYRYEDSLIIHRIIEIQDNNNTKYFILKGDNNMVKDPYLVSFEQIEFVVVGIVY